MENKTFQITKEVLEKIIEEACEHEMEIQRTINDKYDIPATRIKKYIDKIINTEPKLNNDINYYTELNIVNNKMSYKINVPKNKIKNNSEILRNFMEEHKLVFNDKIDFYINEVKQEFQGIDALKELYKSANEEFNQMQLKFDFLNFNKIPENFKCQQCGDYETGKMCSKYCVVEYVKKQSEKIENWREPTEEELKIIKSL